MSNMRHGLCMAILAIMAALGANACIASAPTEDDVITAKGEVQEGSTLGDESVGETSQPLCQGDQPGAHCTVRCGAYNWYHYYDVAYGHCDDKCWQVCGGNCQVACWSL